MRLEDLIAANTADPNAPFHQIVIVDNTTVPPTTKEGTLDVVDGQFVLTGDFTAEEFKAACFEMQTPRLPLQFRR